LQEKSERLGWINKDIEVFDGEIEETTLAGVADESEALGFNRLALDLVNVSRGSTTGKGVETPLDHDFVLAEVARFRRELNLCTTLKIKVVAHPDEFHPRMIEQVELDGFPIHEAEGILFNGTVYVVNNNMPSVAQIHEIALHEAGHYSQRALCGIGRSLP